MRLKNRQSKWRQLLTALLVAVGMLTASAQPQAVKGVVTDAADGEPLIGATVMVKETKAGTVTDLHGNFTAVCVGIFPHCVKVNRLLPSTGRPLS